MSCYYPMDAYISNRFINPKTGKGKVCFLKPGTVLHDAPGGFKYYYADSETAEIVMPFKVPCGQCIGCRLDYSRSWANRCVLEAMMYDVDKCWFLTLTYESPPVSYPFKKGIIDGKIGCVRDFDSPVYTLFPKDVQDFMKRLRITYQRKFNHDGVRFYLCGEYGDHTCRPHYHLIVFNLPIHDLTYFGKNRQGDILYNSDLIQDTWSHGYVVIGACTWNTCAYTARYVMKKAKGKEARANFAMSGLEPEFVRMSRRPGIGVPYFEAHKDEIYRPVKVDGFDLEVPAGKVCLPNGKVESTCRLFDDKYGSIDYDHAVRVALLHSKRRSIAEDIEKSRRFATSLCDEEYFSLQECEKQKIAKYLQGIL